MRSWRALEKAAGRRKGLTPSKLKMTPSGCAAQFVFGNQSKLTVGSGVDSYYEYLLKMWLYTGKRVEQYKRMYLESVRGMQRQLIFTEGGYTFLAEANNRNSQTLAIKKFVQEMAARKAAVA
mgnify:CR=1 FL=1